MIDGDARRQSVVGKTKTRRREIDLISSRSEHACFCKPKQIARPLSGESVEQVFDLLLRTNETYTLTSQTNRLVYIQHPMRQGWKLADEAPKPDSHTATYRFRVSLKAHGNDRLPSMNTES